MGRDGGFVDFAWRELTVCNLLAKRPHGIDNLGQRLLLEGVARHPRLESVTHEQRVRVRGEDDFADVGVAPGGFRV